MYKCLILHVVACFVVHRLLDYIMKTAEENADVTQASGTGLNISTGISNQ